MSDIFKILHNYKLKVNLMLGAFPMNIFEQIIGEIVVRLVLGIIELLKDTA